MAEVICKTEIGCPAWLCALFPEPLRSAVADRAIVIEEICLRLDRNVTLLHDGVNEFLPVVTDRRMMDRVFTALCGGSLYAHDEEIRNGFLSLSGGVRVGIGGQATLENGQVSAVKNISVLNIRLPHRVPLYLTPLLTLFQSLRNSGGLLLYSPPGGGKTTCLREIGPALASGRTPLRVVVVDSRGELDPGNDPRLSLSVLQGYPRDLGLEMAIRTLNAQVTICDEIGDRNEALALIRNAHCGVPCVASAHAATVEELLRRPTMALLHKARVFGAYVGLSRMPDGQMRFAVTRWEEIRSCGF